MGRKRLIGNSRSSSSDDDFHPGSAENTSKISRLKRKRRSSLRITSRSDDQSLVDRGNETKVICVPESSEGEQEENGVTKREEEGIEVPGSDGDDEKEATVDEGGGTEGDEEQYEGASIDGQDEASTDRTGGGDSVGEPQDSNGRFDLWTIFAVLGVYVVVHAVVPCAESYRLL